MKKVHNISGLLIISLLMIPLLAAAQHNPYEDNIASIISSKNENQSVMFTAVVNKWLDEQTFIVDDKTGSINVSISSKEKPDLISGDELSISGKVKLTDNGDKEIRMTSFRKLKFVKDPANCCRPEVD